jgi:hypothetical protein
MGQGNTALFEHIWQRDCGPLNPEAYYHVRIFEGVNGSCIGKRDRVTGYEVTELITLHSDKKVFYYELGCQA